MRLLIVRHGETIDNVEHRISGRSDCALTDNGRRQAARLADRLAIERLDAIVTSPLVRAGDTAAVVAGFHALTVRVDADLTEVGMGDWENRRLADIDADDPDALARWRHRPAQNPPPGGETLAELADRAERALRRFNDTNHVRELLGDRLVPFR